MRHLSYLIREIWDESLLKCMGCPGLERNCYYGGFHILFPLLLFRRILGRKFREVTKEGGDGFLEIT